MSDFFIPHSKPKISTLEQEEVLKVVKSGFVGKGKKTLEVTEIINDYLSLKNSFLVNSGSSALFLAMKSLYINEGDEVILSEYSCPSLYNQILNLNAVPVSIDTQPGSFFIDIQALKKRVNSKTKAIIFYHPFGYFDHGILELKPLGIPIIEDITHSFSANYNNVFAGSVGDIVVSSLGSTKFITSGTGGIIGSNNDKHLNAISYLLDYDYNDYEFELMPKRYNFQLGDLNAALLLGQFKNLDNLIKRRKEIASKFAKCKFAFFHPNFESAVHFRFFIRPPKSSVQKLIGFLKSKGIICFQGGIKLISDIKSNNKLLLAQKLHSELISIPIYPSLRNEEVNYIIKTINELEI